MSTHQHADVDARRAAIRSLVVRASHRRRWRRRGGQGVLALLVIAVAWLSWPDREAANPTPSVANPIPERRPAVLPGPGPVTTESDVRDIPREWRSFEFRVVESTPRELDRHQLGDDEWPEWIDELPSDEGAVMIDGEIFLGSEFAGNATR